MKSNPIHEALDQLVERLERGGIPYMLIGGLAAIAWGQTRFTRDIDVTVLVPPEAVRKLADGVLEGFPKRIPDAVEFAAKSRVLLVEAPNGVPIDISLGILPFELEAIEPARTSWSPDAPVSSANAPLPG